VAAERKTDGPSSKPETTPAPPGVAGKAQLQAADSPRGGKSSTVPEEKATQPVRADQPVVRPDPLTPRRINTPTRSTRSNGVVRSGPRSYGPPISSGHPIAGTTSPDNYLASDRISRAALTPVNAASSAPRLVAASELVKVTTEEPTYPARALRNGIEGWVEVEFTVTGAGDVRDMVITGSQPSGVFEDAAKDALANWRFAPHLENGQPVPLRSVVTFRFQVEG
jgi:protein TonB